MKPPLSMRLVRAAAPAIVLVLLATAGCATTKLPVRLDEEGRPETFKRVERKPQRDFLNHISRTAYRPPSRWMSPEGEAQVMLVEAWGRPDYVRRLRSLIGERVVEWLYLEEAAVFQFVGRELVFEGPITDTEQVLLIRGRPDRAEISRNERDGTREQFIYLSWGLRQLEQFYMVNGYIIHSAEGS